MTPDTIRKSLFGETLPTISADTEVVINRPPTLCAGCPHRGFFYEIAKRKNVMISGDIGCYTLGMAPPYNAMDSTICMGASLSIGHGAQRVFDMTDRGTRVVSVLGAVSYTHLVVAQITDAPRLVMEWQGQKIVDLAREFLNTNGSEKHICCSISKQQLEIKKISVDFIAAYQELAHDLNLSLIHIF